MTEFDKKNNLMDIVYLGVVLVVSIILFITFVGGLGLVTYILFMSEKADYFQLDTIVYLAIIIIGITIICHVVAYIYDWIHCIYIDKKKKLYHKYGLM